MRKFLALILLVIFAFSITACNPWSDSSTETVVINGVEYCFDDYGDEPHYYLYKAIDKNITEVTIPDYINGYPVRSIGKDSGGWTVSPFENCYYLKTIVIPDTVQVIGSGAFEGCEALENIDLPKSIKSIGGYAFKRCVSLKSITIPNAVDSIGLACFKDCKSLESITMPSNLKVIYDSAFEGCSSLKEIILPNGITTIWDKAFLDCVSLKKIVLPDSITQIGCLAFWGCGLDEIKIPKGVTIISDHLTYNSNIRKVYIPKSVTKIEKSAFRYAQIYYEGTKEEWANIIIEEGNEFLYDFENLTFGAKW